MVEDVNSIIDELLLLQEHLNTVIEDYSYINIRLQLNFKPYILDTLFVKRKHTNRFHYNKTKKINDFRETLHNTCEMLDKILRRKYCCIDEDIKLQINKDIDEALELVAKCLILDEKIKH